MLRFRIQEPRRGQLRRALQLPLGMLLILLALGAPKEAWACACVPVENAWDDLVLFYGTALEKAERPEFPTSCESREEAWADESGSPSEQTARAGRYLVESSNVLPAGEEVVLFARAGSCGQLPLELGHKGVVGAKWSSGVLVTHNCFQLFDDWKEIHRRLGVPADPPKPTSVQALPAGAKLSQQDFLDACLHLKDGGGTTENEQRLSSLETESRALEADQVPSESAAGGCASCRVGARAPAGPFQLLEWILLGVGALLRRRCSPSCAVESRALLNPGQQGR